MTAWMDPVGGSFTVCIHMSPFFYGIWNLRDPKRTVSDKMPKSVTSVLVRPWKR